MTNLRCGWNSQLKSHWADWSWWWRRSLRRLNLVCEGGVPLGSQGSLLWPHGWYHTRQAGNPSELLLSKNVGYISNKSDRLRAGEMAAQCLRVYAALPGDLNLIISTYIGWLVTFWTPAPGGSEVSSFFRHLHITPPLTYIIKKNKNKWWKQQGQSFQNAKALLETHVWLWDQDH